MSLTVLEIAGDEIGYKSLRYSDFVGEIGSWSAELDEIHGFDGFSTVEIKKDGVTEFKGRIQQPGKRYDRSGQGMNIGGPEWTARLIDNKTPHAVISSSPIGDALDVILQESDFQKGDVDSFESSQDPYEWDTSLQFLKFTFSEVCIVYAASVEVTSELSTDNMDVPKPSLKGCFWYGGATRRFYVVAYDKTANQLKYNFTANGLTWNGWNTFAGATPAANEGQSGWFSVAWHNNKVYLMVRDSGNDADMWRGTINDGTGVITLAKVKDNVCGFAINGFWAPLVFDDSDHIWVFYIHNNGNSNARESEDDGASWTYRCQIVSPDEGKYAFPRGSDGDIIIIAYDSGNKDVEEWLWDRSAGTNTFQRKIDDINNSSMGYADGHKNKDNTFLGVVWEDKTAGGDSDMMFSSRREDTSLPRSYSWDTPVEVVGDANYASNNFGLSGDDAQGLYLFWKKKAAGLQLSRYFEGSWDSTVELDSDCYAGDGIDCPEENLAVFCVWKDAAEDVHFALLSPYGVVASRDWKDPFFHETHESTHDYDGLYDRTNGTITPTDTSNPYNGVKNLKVEVDAGQDWKGDYYGVDVTTRTGSTPDEAYLAARNVKVENDADDNDHCMMFRFGGRISGQSKVYYGIRKISGVWKWAVWAYDDVAGWSYTYAGSVDLNEKYDIECGHFRHGSSGWARLWVNGVLMVNVTGLDNDSAIDDLWACFGGIRVDTPAGNGQAFTMDDCQVSLERIGPACEGYAKTDTYQASGLLRWGTLSSPSHSRPGDSTWDVLKASDESELASDLQVPVDLDDAGVPSTETDVKIKPELKDGGVLRNYVFEVHLSIVTGAVDMETDHENCYIGVSKAAKMLDAEFKLNYSDKVDFKTALGEDKSDVVVFKTARSASYDYDVEINVRIVNRVPDYQHFANCVKVLGEGDHPDRIEAEAKNYTSIAEMAAILGGSHNGEIWITIIDKDAVSTGMAQNRANYEVAARSSPKERITLEVLNEYDPGLIQRGDTVTAVDENTGLEQAVRIVGITKEIDSSGNEKTTLEVVSRIRLSEYVKHLVSVNDGLRWA